MELANKYYIRAIKVGGMPRYEVTLITRSLAKPELVETLKRAACTILDHGCVIEKVESLGHRDLPYRRNSKITREPVYATNYFLMHTHMPLKKMHDVIDVLKNDKDLLKIFAVGDHDKAEQPEDCNLSELLKPPAYRKSVEDLRQNQRLGHFPRMRLYKRVEREWKAVPKSYTVPPPRE